MRQTIELRELRIFLTLAEELHFGRTAERLRISQSRVSQAIQVLEAGVGGKLFERTSRRVRLTPVGERLLLSATPAYDQLQRAFHDARETAVLANRGEYGTIRIGYIYSAVFDTLPRLVAAMNETHPGITIEVRDCWTPELDDALMAGTYDLVLSRDMPQRPEYRHETLRAEGLVAVVGEDHPLGGCERAELREFAGQRFCHPSRHLAPGRHDFMMACLGRTGETFEYWESPIHGLGHLDLSDRRSFALVVASAAGQVPVGTTTIAITDHLPSLELQMVWKRTNTSATLERFIRTARSVGHRQGWNDSDRAARTGSPTHRRHARAADA